MRPKEIYQVFPACCVSGLSVRDACPPHQWKCDYTCPHYSGLLAWKRYNRSKRAVKGSAIRPVFYPTQQGGAK